MRVFPSGKVRALRGPEDPDCRPDRFRPDPDPSATRISSPCCILPRKALIAEAGGRHHGAVIAAVTCLSVKAPGDLVRAGQFDSTHGAGALVEPRRRLHLP
jgi:hypothetical protein